MAFNNWPYTNFQDLNLGWILATYKNALNKALEALGKASAVEAEVATYTDQINAANLAASQANATANQAMTIASNANEVLFISADAENKAVNYVSWSQGGTGYVTAADIYDAIVDDHKVPVFMDRSQYVYEMAGYETDPESPLTITRFKFQKDGGNRQDVVWIDGTGSITYTTAYRSGGTLDVNITSLQSTGVTSCDKTFNEISQAYNSGMTVRCHVVDEVHNVEFYAYDCEFVENSETGDYYRWCSPYYSAVSGFYKPFLREDGLCNIGVTTISGGGGTAGVSSWNGQTGDVTYTAPVTSVNGMTGSITGVVLYTSQSVSNLEKAQARSNIGAGHYNVGVSADETLMTITDVVTGTANAYQINKPPYQIPVQYVSGVYATSATGNDVLDHINNCVIVFNGAHYYQIGATLSGAFGHAYFACIDPSANGKYEVDIFHVELNGNDACTVTKYDKDISLLPAVSSADTGKFLRVNSSGAWVAETVPSAESNSFGGV